ncbi:MAG TPA: hypothetical protein VNF05_08325 [Acidimicrobiales bacterium]|nr:hypothetical protein [Acidimicrobiales bacterium]
MRKWTSRGLVAVGIVATLGLSAPVLASAGSNSQDSPSSKGSHPGIASYRTTRRAIQAAFRDAVNLARTAYQNSLATASSSAQRSAARQIFEVAIIQAAATRSASLTRLGPEPGKSNGTKGRLT